MELAFQLYSARFAPSLEATIALLADIGYTHVEPYGGLYANTDRLAAAMADHGLEARSGHFDLADLERDARGMVAVADRLGIELVVVPAIPAAERTRPVTGWRDLAARLEALAGILGAAGKRLAWHNHDFEFAVLDDGTLPMAHILEGAPSIAWQVDVAWVARGGQVPWTWLERYRDRIGSLHLKDLAPEGECADEDGWADFGCGVMDWAGHWDLVHDIAPRNLVVEHDRPSDVERFARRAHASALRLHDAT